MCTLACTRRAAGLPAPLNRKGYRSLREGETRNVVACTYISVAQLNSNLPLKTLGTGVCATSETISKDVDNYRNFYFSFIDNAETQVF